ncbi:MAG: DUF4430 domain-containing protein [Oscillospiraceae bacterium]
MKKIISLMLAVMLTASMFVGCSNKLNVTVNVSQDGKVTLEKAYKTDAETLENLLVEKTEELGATLTDSDYGKFVEGMNGYKADVTKNEFFEVLVDDVSSQVGISEIKLEDGKVYTFKLSKF